jgi:hypothetical protein
MSPQNHASNAGTSLKGQASPESYGGPEPEPTSEPCEILWIPAALDEMSYTLSSKNADYRIDGEFSNFEYAAKVAGVPVLRVILAQIGIKVGRLIGQMDSDGPPNYESISDTIKDLHGYAAILHGYDMKVNSK